MDFFSVPSMSFYWPFFNCFTHDFRTRENLKILLRKCWFSTSKILFCYFTLKTFAMWKLFNLLQLDVQFGNRSLVENKHGQTARWFDSACRFPLESFRTEQVSDLKGEHGGVVLGSSRKHLHPFGSVGWPTSVSFFNHCSVWVRTRKLPLFGAGRLNLLFGKINHQTWLSVEMPIVYSDFIWLLSQFHSQHKCKSPHLNSCLDRWYPEMSPADS